MQHLASVTPRTSRGQKNVYGRDGKITEVEGHQIFLDQNHVVLSLAPLYDTLRSLANSLYFGPFRNTLNAGGKTDHVDIQIGQFFIAQFRELKTGNNKTANIEISRLTEDIRRVFQFDTLDISSTADNSSLHLTVNGRPYKQHEVGSGLMHFLIVLANAAIKRPKWILIDEPELNSRPALQLDFLNRWEDMQMMEFGFPRTALV